MKKCFSFIIENAMTKKYNLETYLYINYKK